MNDINRQVVFDWGKKIKNIFFFEKKEIKMADPKKTILKLRQFSIFYHENWIGP